MADMQIKPEGVFEIEKASQTASNNPQSTDLKIDQNGLVLDPQPSDDPCDPLNWRRPQKLLILAVISFASFSCSTQAGANASGLGVQAQLYGKTMLQLSYSLSSANSGFAAGPLIWTPLAKCYGKSRVMFWSLILGLVCNIWSAVLTKPDQYNNFVVSRLFAALLGSAPQTVGSTFITEMFFLHDRGKALGVYVICTFFGIVIGPTFSGFIVQSADWTVQFWYVVALMGVSAILCLVILEETTWNREAPPSLQAPDLPERYFGLRAAIFLPGRRLSEHKLGAETAKLAKLFIDPVCIIAGFCVLVLFGWVVSINSLLPVFLQNPVIAGGYGFSAIRYASFSFVSWASTIAAIIYGYHTNDRLPLWLYSRRGGEWQPEYRLHCLWLPVLLIYPPALGLFGASLYYHLHYMVVALAVFLIGFSGMACVPPIIQYAIEAVGPELANEVQAVLNFWRMILGISIPFFIDAWLGSVGANWVYIYHNRHLWHYCGAYAPWSKPSKVVYSDQRVRKGQVGWAVSKKVLCRLSSQLDPVLEKLACLNANPVRLAQAAFPRFARRLMFAGQ